ncbi:MAG: 2OG-Fe(II) oxygenase [Cyanobacteria bacterium P01_E01_bin.42]
MMEVEELVPGEIVTISDFLSPEECDEYIDLSEQIGYGEAPINAMRGAIIRPDIRNNARAMLDDPERAGMLWKRLSTFLPDKLEERFPVGLNERLRFYRYDRNQQFAWHYDGSYRRENDESSLLTFMVYLNDRFTGGETQFDLRYPYFDLSVTPKMGMCLCFLHALRHQGAAVIQGRKYVLRSDVMYSPDLSW